MGKPGWPEFACCTASAERNRMVLIQSSSRVWVSVVGKAFSLSLWTAVERICDGVTLGGTALSHGTYYDLAPAAESPACSIFGAIGEPAQSAASISHFPVAAAGGCTGAAEF